MSWAHFLNDGSANYLPGILPAVLISLHQPASMAGALMAALLIGQSLQPLMGWIADRIGGRGMIILGLAASSAGGALLGLAHHVAALVGLLMLIGLGNAMFHPQALSAVREAARSRQGLALSIFLVGGELGRGIWPVLTSMLVVRWGLPSLVVLALPAAVTLPWVVRRAPRQETRRQTGGRVEWPVVPALLLMGLAGVRSTVTYCLVTFIPLLWQFRGGSLVGGASIVSTLIALGIIGNLGGGHLMDRFGKSPVLLISTLLTAALVPAVGYVPGYWIWVTAALAGITLFAGASPTISAGQEIFAANPSLGSGIALGLANGIGAVLVLVVGMFVNPGDIHPVFWLLGAVSLLSTLFLPPLSRYVAL